MLTPRGYSPVSDSEETPSSSERREAKDRSRTSAVSRARNAVNRLELAIDYVVRLYALLCTRRRLFWLPMTLVVALAASLLGVALALYPVYIDMSLDAFNIPNHVVTRRYDALQLAAASSTGRAKRSLTVRCDFGTRGCPKWKFDIVYLPRGGGDDPDNIFTRQRLDDIHDVETSLRAYPRFDDFCWMEGDECVSINSLLTYFYPSYDESGQLKLNGRGDHLIDDNIQHLLRYVSKYPDVYWYVGSGFNVEANNGNLTSHLLRTEVILGGPPRPTDAQEKEARAYMIELTEYLEKSSTKNVRVLYGGGSIYDYQVSQAIYGDMRLAVASLVLIFILVFVLSSFSLYLTVFGLFVVVISFPITYFFYRVGFQIQAVGILNVVSLFVIIGIGVDDVFVFINTFRQTAGKFSNSDVEMLDRMHYTLKTAGKTTLFTSVTTATAFFANVPSAVPAIHDFGLFMGILVLVCYVVTFTMMPPVLFVWAWRVERLEKACIGKKNVAEAEAEANNVYTIRWTQRENAVSMTMPGQEESSSEPAVVEKASCESSESSDSLCTEFNDTPDCQLLAEQISTSARCRNVTQDDVALSATASDVDAIPVEGVPFFSALNRFISRYLSKGIVVSRLPLLLLFFIALFISAGVVSQLKTAKKPPQLFPSDSDIQQLIDIGYNLTNSDQSRCDRCSGYFLDSNDIPVIPKIPTNPPVKKNPTVGPKAPPTPRKLPSTTPHHNDVVTETPPKEKTEKPPPPPSPDRVATNAPPPPHKPTTPKPVTIHHVNQNTPLPIHTKRPKPPTHPHNDVATPKIVVPTKDSEPEPPPVDVCALGDCSPVERPASGHSAVIYVVLGIKGLNRTFTYDSSHVLDDSESPTNTVFDPAFRGKIRYGSPTFVYRSDAQLLDALCDICVEVQDPDRHLIQSGGADCIPSQFSSLATVCKEKTKERRPDYNFAFTASQSPSSQLFRAKGRSDDGSTVLYIAMGFQSNTYMGESSFDNLAKYNQWEKFVDEMKDKYPGIGIDSAFQTSDYWVTVFRETVAVSSAIYSIVLSSILCLCWVIIFTGHAWLLVVVFLSIAGTILTVLSFIYCFGWTFGGVEAITLSVLVGTAVDYIVHVVEAIILAGQEMRERDFNPNVDSQNRARWGISRIGVSILSSALTTIAAAIPLCFTEIQLFAKFGQILLLNTAMSLTYALTACVAMLATFSGLRCCCLRKYKSSCFSCVVSFMGVGICLVAVVLALYIAHVNGHEFPGPDGNPLFSS